MKNENFHSSITANITAEEAMSDISRVSDGGKKICTGNVAATSR